jgi:hypothetical protein
MTLTRRYLLRELLQNDTGGGPGGGLKWCQKRLITSGLHLLRLRHHRQEDDGVRLRHVARRLHPHPGGHEAGPDLRKAVCDKDHEWSYCKKDHLL